MQETRQCQNCHNEFVIEPEDFAFYEKIKVPPPTFCPDCRIVRRMSWRNERSLYHRLCNLCHKPIISVFSTDAPFPVYCNECWWSDKWDSMEYGQEYDFSRPFFAQLKDLSDKVPRLSLTVINNTNSPYVNYTWFSNNSFMCWDLGYGDNVLYSNACHFLKDSMDCSYSKKLELCYELINSKECSRSAYLKDCENCFDSWFLRGCKNCSSCILCENLRNKSYCIENKQYTKEEFERKKKDIIGSFSKLEKTKEMFRERIAKTIFKENSNVQAINCIGNNIWQSKNCQYSFNVFKSENCRFVNDIDSDLKDSMDLSNAAEGELMYEGTSVSGQNLLFNVVAASSFNIFYSILNPKNNNNLFGCVGLRDKSYCILNKQYSEAEYKALLPKIIEHMKNQPYVNQWGLVYKYGEFFPIELSPFAYNETIVQEHFPLTKETATKQGFRWKEPEEKNYKITIKQSDLSDDIGSVTDSIIDEVIGCAHECKCNEQCTTAFRIVSAELQFYKKMNLPLPRLCPNCRHYQRLKQRNPLKLWDRTCAKCGKDIKTSYAPDREEIIYCESCYNSEVA